MIIGSYRSLKKQRIKVFKMSFVVLQQAPEKDCKDYVCVAISEFPQFCPSRFPFHLRKPPHCDTSFGASNHRREVENLDFRMPIWEKLYCWQANRSDKTFSVVLYMCRNFYRQAHVMQNRLQKGKRTHDSACLDVCHDACHIQKRLQVPSECIASPLLVRTASIRSTKSLLTN